MNRKKYRYSYFSANIRIIHLKCDVDKSAFVGDFLSTRQSSIDRNFRRKLRTKEENIDKIFFLSTENGKICRDWLYVDDNVFYCIFCRCFAAHRSDKLSTEGVNYNLTNHCLVAQIGRHEKLNIHAHAVRVYGILSGQDLASPKRPNPTREAVQCIVKCVIYLATHGERVMYSIYIVSNHI